MITVSDPSKISIVGILNVTPDSYFDGGKFVTAESIGERAKQMAEEGADIIEIGGESTGPGSIEISSEEEMKRVVNALEAIRNVLPDHPLSIDTYKSEVLDAASKYSISMVNDVTAGRADPKLLMLAAKMNIKVVLMHAKDPTPRTTRDTIEYDDVAKTVRTFLFERVKLAKKAGIKDEHIILDPGLGHFISADPRYSFELLFQLEEVTQPYPSFVSPSRKSFLAGTENLPVSERLPATLAATALAIEHSARYIRTHDVLETKRLIDKIESVL